MCHVLSLVYDTPCNRSGSWHTCGRGYLYGSTHLYIFIFHKYKMKTFTSSLPEHIFQQLDDMSKRLSLPKNKIIEKALTIYLDQITRAEYIQSYKRASKDEDLLFIAEEGMTDYLKMLNDTDNEAR